MLVILEDDRLWSVGVGTESARPLELATIQLTPSDAPSATELTVSVDDQNPKEN